MLMTEGDVFNTHMLLLLQGNLILADSNYEVLTLLRSHRDDAKGFAIMARHPYPIHTIRLRQALSQEQLSSALDSADEKQTLRGMVLMCIELQVKLQRAANTLRACLLLVSTNQSKSWRCGKQWHLQNRIVWLDLNCIEYQISDSFCLPVLYCMGVSVRISHPAAIHLQSRDAMSAVGGCTSYATVQLCFYTIFLLLLSPLFKRHLPMAVIKTVCSG